MSTRGQPGEVRGPHVTVGLAGSYGGLNAGDEAILTVAIAQLREAISDVRIIVFSRDPDHTEHHHDVEHVVAARQATRDEMVAHVKRLDLLLLGGGGILYDREVTSYLHVVGIAQKLGVPTATFAIGVGPLERPADRQAVCDAVNAMALVTVREPSAKRLLEEIGVERDIVVTADPALLLAPAPFTDRMLEREGLDGERRLVGISVREPGAAGETNGDYHELLANAADFIVERFDAEVVFVALERLDVREAHRVVGHMATPEHATVLKRVYSPEQLRGLMEHLHLAVGMRLHFLIFAATAGVPVAALPYAAKVGSFLQSLGLESSDLARTAHPGVMLAGIDRLWDLRGDQPRHVAPALQDLQDTARRTAQLTAELLLERDGAAAPS